MAYNKEDILEKAKEAIKEHNLYFLSDVIAFIPITKSTFYEYFPANSEQSDELKELLDENRINAKVKIRKNWNDSENATLQMGLYKLIGSDEERRRLNSSYIDQKTEHSGEIKIIREIKR